MKILSLFDGISGLQQAFKNLGIEFDGKNNIYFASEIDKYAIQITQKNFPNTYQIGDVKNVSLNTDIFLKKDREYLPPKKLKDFNFDLMCFGSPCQDLSIAKKDRQGLKGERSGLFFEALRILKEVKPTYFLMENVASMHKSAKEDITKELFDIEPVLLCSSKLTAQNRKRLFWFGKLQEDGTYKKVDIDVPEDKGIFLKDILESGITYQDKSYPMTASYDGAIFWNTLQRSQRSMVAEPLDSSIKISKKITPYFEFSNKTISYLEKINFKGFKNYNEKANTLTSSSYKGIGNDGTTLIAEPLSVSFRGRHLNEEGVREDIKGAKTEQKLEINSTGKCNTLTTVSKDSLVMESTSIRVGHFNSGGQGNRIYSVDGKSVCLSANGGGKGSKTGLYALSDSEDNFLKNKNIYRVENKLIFNSDDKQVGKGNLPDGYFLVRKLTPVEAERLQGFPDNFSEGISQTQRYKCLGNSFTVPVIEHILKEMLGI